MYTSMFRKAMLGDTATLALDFTTGTMPTAVTFTRADSTARATYIDASGYVKTVTSAGNPRFDYTGGVAKGLLIEAAATNLCTYSTDLTNFNWTLDNSSCSNPEPTSVSQTGPNGASSVIRVTFNKTGGAFSRIRRAVSVSNGAYIMSIWMKANTANGGASTQNVGLRLGASAGVNCVVTTTWQRFTHTHTVADGSAEFQIMIWDNIVGNDETADILVYGAQTESGSTATSYIPTGASSLTRLADDAVISSTAWTSLYSKPGTIVVEYYRGEYGAGDRSVLAIDTAATKHIHLKHANASAASGIYNSAGSGVANKIAGNVTGLNKAAFSWSSANPSIIKYALNGNAVVVSGTSDIGATLGTWMTIGSASTTGVSGSGTWEGYLNNSIKSVKYYSELLTDAEMIAKTT